MAGYWWIAGGGEEEQAAEPYRVVRVERGPLRLYIESTGTVEALKEVEIKCEASGEVLQVPVDVSDVVEEGDLLVQLNPRDENLLVQRSEVAAQVAKAREQQANLALEVSRQTLENMRVRSTSSLASAEALVRETTDRLASAEQLQEKNMTSMRALQAAQTSHAQALAALQSARVSIKELDVAALQINSLEQDVVIAKQNVVASKIDLDEAQDRLRDTTVSSPMHGVVTARDVQVGQIISSGTSNVSGGSTVLYIADLSQLFVSVAVDESDIGQVRTGQDVVVTADAFPRQQFPGAVVRVATKGQANNNVVTFAVKVEVTGPDRSQLMPGMTADAEIVIAAKADILRVSADAVRQTGTGAMVTIRAADDTITKRAVELGESDGEWCEVISGLEEGQEVLVPQVARSQWRCESSQQSALGGLPSVGGGQSPMPGARP